MMTYQQNGAVHLPLPQVPSLLYGGLPPPCAYTSRVICPRASVLVVTGMPRPDLPSRKDQPSQLEAMLVSASHRLSALSEIASAVGSAWLMFMSFQRGPYPVAGRGRDIKPQPFPPNPRGCHWADIKARLLPLSKPASFLCLSQVLTVRNKPPVP